MTESHDDTPRRRSEDLAAQAAEIAAQTHVNSVALSTAREAHALAHETAKEFAVLQATMQTSMGSIHERMNQHREDTRAATEEMRQGFAAVRGQLQALPQEMEEKMNRRFELHDRESDKLLHATHGPIVEGSKGLLALIIVVVGALIIYALTGTADGLP